MIEARVANVVERQAGTELATAALTGESVLEVEDVEELDLDGGTLQLGDEVIAYSVEPPDEETLEVVDEAILAEPLAEDHEIEEPVLVYPPALERFVIVVPPDGDEDLEARIPHALYDRLAVGSREDDDTAEVVLIDLEDDEMVVTDVLDTEPLIDGGFIDPTTLTPGMVSDGDPPASSPATTVTGGPGYLVARWEGVANADLVSYEVYLSDSSGFTPDAGTKVGEVTGTSFVATEDGAGDPLELATTYYVRVIACDEDGCAAPGTEGSGALVPLDIPYIEPIDFSDLAGTVAEAQLVSLAASKVTGALSAAQIDTVTAAQVTGMLADSQLAAIAAGKITGTLADSQIAAIAASKVTGQLTADQLDVSIGGGNLIKDSSFEHPDAPAWYSYAGEAVQSVVASSVSLTARHGARVARVAPINTSGFDGTAAYLERVADNLYPVQEGEPVSASVYLSPGGSTPRTGRVFVRFFDDAFAFLSDIQGPNVAEVAGEWVRLTAEGVEAPTGAAWAQFYAIVWSGSAFTGEPHYFDGAQLEHGDVPTAYAPKPDEILPGVITATELADDAVTSPKIVAGAVVAGKIGAGAVEAGKIAADAVSTAELAAGAVTAAELAAGSVETAKLAAGAVTANKLSVIVGGGNLVPDSSFETDPISSNWGYGAWDPEWTTLARTTSQHRTGAAAASITRPAGKGTDRMVCYTAAAIPVQAGDKVAGSAYFKAATTPRDATAVIYFYDSLGAYLSEIESTILTTGSSSAWTRVSVTGTVPVGAVGARAGIRVWAVPEGEAHYVDDVQLELGDVVTAYAPRADELLPGTILAAHLAAGSVIAGKIGADAVTANEIAANAVTTPKLNAGAVTAAKIGAGEVIAGKIAADAVTANEIAANAVTTAKLAANAVTAAKIGANEVTAGKIAADAVTANEIAAGAVNTAELAAGAVIADRIATGVITANELAANSVDVSELAASAVTAVKIAAGAVETAKLAANAVTASKLEASLVLASKIIAGDASGARVAFGILDDGSRGIKGWASDGTTNTFSLDADSGDVRLSGLVDFGTDSHLTADDVLEVRRQSTTGFLTPKGVQTAFQEMFFGATSVTATFPGPTAAGNVTLAIVRSASTVTNSTPAGWTKELEVTNGAERVTLFRRNVTTGGFTSQTFAFSGTTLGGVTMLEVFGITNAAPQKTATNTGTGNSASTGTTAATTSANSFILAAILSHHSVIPAPTPSTPSGYIRSRSSGSFADRYSTYWKAVTATGTQSAASTLTSGNSWEGLIATFPCRAVADPETPESGKVRHYAKNVSGNAIPHVLTEDGKIGALIRALDAKNLRFSFGTQQITMGTATGAVTQTTAHGLGNAPTYAFAVVDSTAGGNSSKVIVSVSTLGASTITLRARTGDGSAYGAAGATLDVIWFAVATS